MGRKTASFMLELLLLQHWGEMVEEEDDKVNKSQVTMFSLLTIILWNAPEELQCLFYVISTIKHYDFPNPLKEDFPNAIIIFSYFPSFSSLPIIIVLDQRVVNINSRRSLLADLFHKD